MLAGERQEQILNYIHTNTSAKTADLIKLFQVSNETIRRDLDFLESRGFIKKVYGGAMLNRHSETEPPYHERANVHLKEKAAIGFECAKLINNGESIFVDLGTTPMEVVKCLQDKKDITIFTTSLFVANYAADKFTDIKCIMLGGEVRKKEKCVNGSMTEGLLEGFYFDKSILSAGGIDEIRGLTDYDINDVKVKAKVVKSTKENIVVTDSSKFGLKVLSSAAKLSQLKYIITDNKVDQYWKQKVEEQGCSLIVANT